MSKVNARKLIVGIACGAAIGATVFFPIAMCIVRYALDGYVDDYILNHN